MSPLRDIGVKQPFWTGGELSRARAWLLQQSECDRLPLLLLARSGSRLGTGRLKAAHLHSPTVNDSVEANLALARRGNELWNTGGVEASKQIWAPDIVYEAPEFPDTGVFHGVEALAAHAREQMEAAGHYQFKLLSLEGRGDYVLSALEVSMEGSSSGAAVTTPFFQVARYGGGQLIELRSYLDGDQARREYEDFTARSD